MEFLTDMVTTVPEGTPDAEVEATKARSAVGIALPAIRTTDRTGEKV